MFRGGCWIDSVTSCRSAFRFNGSPSSRDFFYVGFRVALSPELSPLWAPAARVVRHEAWFDAQQGFPAHIWGMSFSPDGSAYQGVGDAGPRGAVRLWNTATGQQLQEFVTGKDVWFGSAMFLPAGQQILTAYSNDKNLYLWDVATGRVVHEFTGHTDQGIVAGLSADGRRAVSSGKDETLRLWDVATAREIWQQAVPGEKLSRLAFSRDGNLLLTSDADQILRTRDAETGKVLVEFDDHAASCSGEFLPDGTQVLSWGDDGLVRLWEARTGKKVQSFGDAQAPVWRAWFLPESREIVAWGNDKVFRVWDAVSGEKRRQFPVADFNLPGVGEAVFAPDGRRLLVSDGEGDVRLFDFASGTEFWRSERQQLPKARGFAFSPDGKHVAAGSFRSGIFLIQINGLAKGVGP